MPLQPSLPQLSPPAAIVPVAGTIALWSILAGIGYNRYQNTNSGDNDTAAGRLALGVTLPTHWRALDLGFETGIQNGNSMKLSTVQGNSEQCGVSGTTSIQTTVKPVVDLLATAHLSLNSAKTIFVVAKVGAAYRKWQFDRASIPNNSQINDEVQAGFGIKLTPNTTLTATYQGVGILNSDVKVDTGINKHGATSIKSIKNIPTQHGVFLNIGTTL